MEAPVLFGDGDGERFFLVCFGFKICEEGIAVDVEGGFVFTGEGVELAGEAVTEGVDATVFFTVRGFGAGGFLRVLLVGRELRGGDAGWFGGRCHGLSSRPRNSSGSEH